jgi:Ca2+/Na+ antiporter
MWTSIKEKQYWFWVILVYVTILSTLFIGQPLANELRDQNVQAIFFLLGMALVATAVIIHGIVNKPSKIEYAILFGIIAVYIMFFFRLGAPERSHLIEYSVLAILLHKAFKERFKLENKIFKPAIFSLFVGFVMGTLDESIQLLIPHRYFDPQDILFNCLAITMAIGASLLLQWLHKRLKKMDK